MTSVVEHHYSSFRLYKLGITYKYFNPYRLGLSCLRGEKGIFRTREPPQNHGCSILGMYLTWQCFFFFFLAINMFVLFPEMIVANLNYCFKCYQNSFIGFIFQPNIWEASWNQCWEQVLLSLKLFLRASSLYTIF